MGLQLSPIFANSGDCKGEVLNTYIWASLEGSKNIKYPALG